MIVGLLYSYWLDDLLYYLLVVAIGCLVCCGGCCVLGCGLWVWVVALLIGLFGVGSVVVYCLLLLVW